MCVVVRVCPCLLVCVIVCVRGCYCLLMCVRVCGWLWCVLCVGYCMGMCVSSLVIVCDWLSLGCLVDSGCCCVSCVVVGCYWLSRCVHCCGWL